MHEYVSDDRERERASNSRACRVENEKRPGEIRRRCWPKQTKCRLGARTSAPEEDDELKEET